MTITSVPNKDSDEVIGFFTRGIIFKGVAYGPDHADVPVIMRRVEAREYIQRGVFQEIGLADIPVMRLPPPVPIDDIADPVLADPVLADPGTIRIVGLEPPAAETPAPRRRGRPRKHAREG